MTPEQRLAYVRKVLDQASERFRQTSTWIDLNRALASTEPLLCPACGADYAEAEAKNQRLAWRNADGQAVAPFTPGAVAFPPLGVVGPAVKT